MEMISAKDLRSGHAFKYNDSVWQVLEQEFNKPGKGQAKMIIRMKDLRTGSIINTTLNPNNKYEKCMIDKKDMLFSYIDGDSYVFMDNETYDQIPFNYDSVKEAYELSLMNGTGDTTFDPDRNIKISLFWGLGIQNNHFYDTQ